jgi:hypothetical protein
MLARFLALPLLVLFGGPFSSIKMFGLPRKGYGTWCEWL